jgi:hypothetical protein
MRFILGLLVGYSIRGKQRLLIATLSAIAVGCFIVVPAIALSLLALDVRRERLSRPPQTTVPPHGLDTLFKCLPTEVNPSTNCATLLLHP